MRHFTDLSSTEAEAYRDAYVAALPELRARLHRRVERTGGPELDGGVDSLAPLGVWFFEQLTADAQDGLTEYPMWWEPGAENIPDFLGINGPLPTPRQLRLVDETGAYLAHVLQVAFPQARWIVYRRDPRIRDAEQHHTVLEGPFGTLRPVSIVYGQAIGVTTYRRVADPGAVHRFVSEELHARAGRNGG